MLHVLDSDLLYTKLPKKKKKDYREKPVVLRFFKEIDGHNTYEEVSTLGHTGPTGKLYEYDKEMSLINPVEGEMKRPDHKMIPKPSGVEAPLGKHKKASEGVYSFKNHKGLNLELNLKDGVYEAHLSFGDKRQNLKVDSANEKEALEQAIARIKEIDINNFKNNC